MIGKKFITIFFLFFCISNSYAQGNCILGQTPATSFPVCGTDTFFQSTVPACGGKNVPSPGCTGLSDLNPFWYRFTCFSTGTFGFVITPNDLADDYDWQLFDITGKDANDVYTDLSMFVACNWAGEPGKTGSSPAGTKLVTCGDIGLPYSNPFSSMPGLIQGHEYILLVSHFTTTSQSGYSLSFGGNNSGTASITDTTLPGLKSARAICDGVKMTVKLNKKMKCSSLNADGSDFIVTPSVAPIIAAEGINCGNGFDMDSILLTLATPIPPGKYTIAVKSDVNGINLLDNCSRSIPDGQSYPVEVFPVFPTPFDSIFTISCSPDVLEFVFRTPMLCNSVAPDGSDFIVTGSTAVTVQGAGAICSAEGLTNSIQVKLSAPILQKGNYRITLKTGSDGNTLLNECGKETPAGSFLFFNTKDTVNATFTSLVLLGCKTNTVQYFHDGRNEVNSWKWTFNNISSIAKDTSIFYPISVSQTATLNVSNGTCTDTKSATVFLDNGFNAALEASNFVCPGDPAIFKDKSTGKFIRQWDWNFGDGKTSNVQTPPNQFYAASNSIRDVLIKLIVKDSIGCADTASTTIKVVGNCYIAIPTAFTPNSDGLNDFLYPTNAYKAKNLYFAIYNRVGQKLFETSDWTNKWDGTFKGNPQDPGTYVWILNYTNVDSGKTFNLKGSTVLLR